MPAGGTSRRCRRTSTASRWTAARSSPAASTTTGRWLVRPTIVADLPLTAPPYCEEIFGPVCVVNRFDSEDEVVGLANDTRYGLNAMLFTENLSRAHRVASKLRAGTVWVNCFFIRDLRTPFGGVGDSGVGREGGNFSARVLHRAQGRRHADPTVMATTSANPEIASSIEVNGVLTNYHDLGEGPRTVVLIHGSGPGVSAWANWRLTHAGIGEPLPGRRPGRAGVRLHRAPRGGDVRPRELDDHLLAFVDELDLDDVCLVGNSFGGALALSMTTTRPGLFSKLVLMGSVGVPFEITRGLDTVWGFEPTMENMRELLGVFAHDQSMMTDELAASRLVAATRPGVQEAFSAMFPAPRQQGVDGMTLDEHLIAAIDTPTLVIHGRDDQVIPLSNSLRLLELIGPSQLHVFGNCGHWVQIEHAEEFNRLVGDFLAD